MQIERKSLRTQKQIANYATLALRRVLVIDKCGSAAPRRRQAHAVERARRAENESEAESPAEPLGRPSAFSLSRDFPSSRLLHFYSGDFICLAIAVLRGDKKHFVYSPMS